MSVELCVCLVTSWVMEVHHVLAVPSHTNLSLVFFMSPSSQALKMYMRARDHCTSSKHIVQLCLNIIKVLREKGLGERGERGRRKWREGGGGGGRSGSLTIIYA